MRRTLWGAPCQTPTSLSQLASMAWQGPCMVWPTRRFYHGCSECGRRYSQISSSPLCSDVIPHFCQLGPSVVQPALSTKGENACRAAWAVVQLSLILSSCCTPLPYPHRPHPSPPPCPSPGTRRPVLCFLAFSLHAAHHQLQICPPEISND